MEKHRAIPEGYMRIGELAKKAGVTVRALQYYDKEGLLTPSGASEGGFRLYTYKDGAKLAQILLMKQLGFSLGEIKQRLTSLDTPSDVVNVLTEHAAKIRSKIEQLSASLAEIEALRDEIAQMETVDIKRLMAILMNLQMNNKHYWMVKYFDPEDLDKISKSMSVEQAGKIIEASNRLMDQALKYQKEGIAPESEQGQAFAKEFWDTMMESVGGNMELLQKMSEIAELDNSEEFQQAKLFLGPAIELYVSKLGMEGVLDD